MSNSTKPSVSPRLDLAAHAGAALSGLIRFSERITLEPVVYELVKLRASQLNGCARCIDMHWTAAREAGESELRLAQVSAWSESPYFDERERSALALTDAVTRLCSTGVDDEVWDEATAHFPPDELAQLVMAIATINTWNRLNVTVQSPPLSYQPEISADEPAAV